MDYIKYFNSEIGLHLKFEKSKPLFDFLRNYIRFSKTKISSKTLNTITLNNNNIKIADKDMPIIVERIFLKNDFIFVFFKLIKIQFLES